MLYFMPAHDNMSVSPVPFTSPCKTQFGSTWVGPKRDEKYGHYDYYARITCNGIIVWEYLSDDNIDAEQEMSVKMDYILRLAKTDSNGLIDLMHEGGK